MSSPPRQTGAVAVGNRSIEAAERFERWLPDFGQQKTFSLTESFVLKVFDRGTRELREGRAPVASATAAA